MKSENWLNYITKTDTNNNKMILVRLIVGFIFLTEGIEKYLFPELLGTGRFFKIGFSDPSFWAYFTVAFVSTKWPVLMDKGFWQFAHEYRTDFAMTLLLIYLFIIGAGKWSVDARISKHLKP
jgi:putative oxidoreductase